MHVLGAVGPGAADLFERLPGRLDGRVATVESVPSTDVDGVDGPADASFELGEGAWSGRGTERSLAGLLDRLAPDFDYALLIGFPGARVPTVTLGDADARSELLAAADAAAVDVDDLAESLAETEPWVTLESLVERIKGVPDADRAGAIATFTGRVRARDDPDDARTTHLEFEKYEGVAERRLDAIERELADRDGVVAVDTHHRTGVIEDGEDIVFVVVLAGHREEAFRTVEDGINRLKDEVPIFKKETTVEDEFWVHDRS